jgi:hypothetical protein
VIKYGCCDTLGIIINFTCSRSRKNTLPPACLEVPTTTPFIREGASYAAAVNLMAEAVANITNVKIVDFFSMTLPYVQTVAGSSDCHYLLYKKILRDETESMEIWILMQQAYLCIIFVLVFDLGRFSCRFV